MNTRSMRGPVDVNKSGSQAVLRPLAFDRVELEASGYLGSWQELNRTATLPHCMTNLEGNGSLDNVRRLVGQSSSAYRGMVFQDSDIYKTLEAVAWVLEGPVRVVAASAGEPLYQPVEARQAPRIRTETRMRAIPYARWANRGPRAMRVWLPLALE